LTGSFSDNLKELKNDPVKQKSLSLFEELQQLQKQKTDLESDQVLSVPEEIERLTQKVVVSCHCNTCKVKATNAEIADIEYRTSASLDRINKLREQIINIDKQIGESKSMQSHDKQLSFPR
jgi:hypothetical protein